MLNLKFCSVLFFLFGIVYGAKLPPSVEIESRIIGGSVAVADGVKYQVSLRNRFNMHYCGGALLSSTFVLTAAHCVYDKEINDVIAVTGALHRVQDGRPYAIQQVIMHPQFSSMTLQFDAALLRSQDPILILPWAIMPIGLESAPVGGGVEGVVVGWGLTEKGLPADYLQKATLQVISTEECAAGLGQNVLDSQLCTAASTTLATCLGDSGGPLVRNIEGGLLIGLVSVPSCTTNRPDIFTRIDLIRDWVWEVARV
jgi:trypsin